MIFRLKFLLKTASKSVFFALAPRSAFRAAISDAVARSSIVFCSSASADCIVMAASILFGPVLELQFLLSLCARKPLCVKTCCV